MRAPDTLRVALEDYTACIPSAGTLPSPQKKTVVRRKKKIPIVVARSLGLGAARRGVGGNLLDPVLPTHPSSSTIKFAFEEMLENADRTNDPAEPSRAQGRARARA